jgi:hypothetical protein
MDKGIYIDGDKKKHWFLEDVLKEYEKKPSKEKIDDIIEIPRKSKKGKLKNKRKKGCGCK